MVIGPYAFVPDRCIINVKAAGICHTTSMEADNIEIVVKPGNWQTPGKAARWSWQVRQKHPAKFLVQGLTSGSEQKARDAANAAKSRILARI
jgi:hypothetical protein